MSKNQPTGSTPQGRPQPGEGLHQNSVDKQSARISKQQGSDVKPSSKQ